MNKRPVQTQQTKENIKNAFWQLYEDNPISRITVKDITQRAGYNRSTFYTYYKDVYDILEEEENILIDFLQASKAEEKTQENQGFSDVVRKNAEFFKANAPRLRLLLGVEGDPVFAKRLKNSMEEMIAENLKHIFKEDVKYFEYVVEYTSSAYSSLISKWLFEGCNMEFEEILKLAHCLALGGMTTLVKKMDQSHEFIINEFLTEIEETFYTKIAQSRLK